MFDPKLVPCRCCGQRVSEEATACPGCGQPFPQPDGDWMVEAKRLLMRGRKIDAIKLVREQSQLGLKEAKDLVESWER